MRAALALCIVACTAAPLPVPVPSRVPAPTPAATADAGTARAPIDAPSQASPEETLAAIQKAMTDLDAVAHQCWASVAVERFDVEGNLEMRIAIAESAASPSAHVDVVTDTTRTPKLVACMRRVLETYAWAPPLRGQTIQLPFRFRAPDMQNVIDRRLVSAATAQSGISIGVLLDEANTGVDAASMLEIAIARGARTGVRLADREELWYFATPAVVDDKPVPAGQIMDVPVGATRDVAAIDAAVRAVIVIVPGGREGAARAGALPTRSATRRGKSPTLPPPGDFRDMPGSQLSGGVFERSLAPVPEAVAPYHQLLYVLAGAGTVTLDGVQLPLGPTTVLQIPPGMRYAMTLTSPLRALQVNVPVAKPAR